MVQISPKGFLLYQLKVAAFILDEAFISSCSLKIQRVYLKVAVKDGGDGGFLIGEIQLLCYGTHIKLLSENPKSLFGGGC